MHENFSSSEESESDSESDDDAIAEADEQFFSSDEEEDSTLPASSGASADAHPDPALHLAAAAKDGEEAWARRREEAAKADAHTKHRRKAMLKRLTKARNRLRECMLRVRERQLVEMYGGASLATAGKDRHLPWRLRQTEHSGCRTHLAQDGAASSPVRKGLSVRRSMMPDEAEDARPARDAGGSACRG